MKANLQIEINKKDLEKLDEKIKLGEYSKVVGYLEDYLILYNFVIQNQAHLFLFKLNMNNKDSPLTFIRKFEVQKRTKVFIWKEKNHIFFT